MNYYLEKIIIKILDLKKIFFKWTTKSIARIVTVILVMLMLLIAMMYVKNNIIGYDYILLEVNYK